MNELEKKMDQNDIEVLTAFKNEVKQLTEQHEKQQDKFNDHIAYVNEMKEKSEEHQTVSANIVTKLQKFDDETKKGQNLAETQMAKFIEELRENHNQ